MVDQDPIRLALRLLAVDAGLGGVLIAGGHGTAKSVMARGIRALLPPIRVIRTSCCNADPADPAGWDDATIARRARATRALPSRSVPAPFVQVPLGVSDDRLLGSVDVGRSIRAGQAVFQPGLLAEAHRGVLLVDEINLLEPSLAALLFNVLAEGVNRVEREGISFRHPCRPRLIATFHPAEGQLPPHWIDRFAVVLAAEAELDLPDRVEAVERVLQWQEARGAFLARFGEGVRRDRRRVAEAVARLPQVRLSRGQIRYLVEEAGRSGAEGQRPELFAARLARAHAALQGRVAVDDEDLRRAVQLVIVPRAALRPAAPPEPPPEPPAPPPAGEEPPEPEGPGGEEEPEEHREGPPPDPEATQAPPSFVFSPEGVVLDPELLAFSLMQRRRLGRSGGRGLVRSLTRGRYEKAVLPRGPITRVAIDATLRAAAPHQRARRRHRRAGRPGRPGRRDRRRVLIREEDLRVKQLTRRAGALVVFVVDASGSMALNRMQAAKGAVLQLLQQAYLQRDRVALVVVQGERARVALPPTRSITAASRRLERLPCGGGTPLAHGLAQAVRMGVNALRGKDVGEVLLVLISDGKANVSLSRSLAAGGSNDSAQRLEELDAIAAAIAEQGLGLLVIDTGRHHLSGELAPRLAARSGGRHVPLPHAGDRAIATLARGAMGR